MHDGLSWLALAAGAVAGSALGLLYFGGLWLTIRALPATRRPLLWLLASFLGRSALALLGFFLLLALGWLPLVVAVAGFTLTRLVLANRLPMVGAPRRRSE